MFDDTNISANPLTVLPPVKPPRRLYTLAEYLRKEERSEELHEYENGIIIKLPMARGLHNIIISNMSAELVFFKKKRKGNTLFSQVNNWCICPNLI